MYLSASDCHWDVIDALQHGVSVDVIYYDIKEAFDSVTHVWLLTKLKAYCIAGKFDGGSLVNLVNHLWFTKLKPSKLVLTISILLADLLIQLTFNSTNY